MSTRDAERLAAGLAEDEAAAQPQADWLREHEKKPGDWTRFMFDPVIGPFGGQSPLRSIDRGLYVGRMADPDRALADIAAKRRILALYEEFAAEQERQLDDPVWNGIAGPGIRTGTDVLGQVVAALAAVYTEAEEAAG